MILLLLSLAPIAVIILYIYFKDKFEKEPIQFLFKNFLLGAFLSVIITVFLSFCIKSVYSLSNPNSIFQQFIKAFFVVSLVEEFSKYIIVKYYAQQNEEFNEPFDGIVYAVIVSMGFAALENVLYVFQFGLSTGLFRAFTAVPAHATFGILMGYFMGKAKFSNKRLTNNLLGLIIATVFHGTYDFFLFINFIPGVAIGAFVSLIIGVFLAKKAMKIHQENSFFKV
mgnify:CR=1 FL=1